MKNTNKSGLATTSLVLGIIGISTSFIPIVNNASFFLGILAAIFGLIPLLKKKSKGKAIAGIILGVLAVVFTLAMQDSMSESLDELTGDATDKVLEEYLEVSTQGFTYTVDEYGYVEESKLTVIVKNKSDETCSFDFTIEAVDSEGVRIDSDTAFINDLPAGRTSNETLFIFETDIEKCEQLKNATFNVIEASKY